MLFSAKDRILFIGDSITDSGRRMEHAPLGNGYVNFIANMIDARYAELELTYFNRGIGGNTTLDLQARWQEDCLDLNCNWVSILVGINDAHRFVQGTADLPPDKYRQIYRALLQQVVEQTPARLILWEPFYFVTPSSTTPKVAEIIADYIAAVNELADEFPDRTVGVIPTQEAFARASQHRWIDFWIPEGVHPSVAGHSFMACEFLKFIGWELR